MGPRLVLLARIQIIIVPHMILGRVILTGLNSVGSMALKLNLIGSGLVSFIWEPAPLTDLALEMGFDFLNPTGCFL